MEEKPETLQAASSAEKSVVETQLAGTVVEGETASEAAEKLRFGVAQRFQRFQRCDKCSHTNQALAATVLESEF